MRGFTLFECLIYLALFGILVAGVFTSISGIIESASRNRTTALLEDEGSYLTEKIQKEMEIGAVPDISLLTDSFISVSTMNTTEITSGNPPQRFMKISLAITATSSAGEVLSRDFSRIFYPTL